VSGGFVTTNWSQVTTARDGTDSAARRALEELCRTYWHPLFEYVRHLGYGPDEAQDLTQEFFADLLERDFLKGVDRAAGRFRSFLLASLKHFLSRERTKAHALKRGGGVATISLDSGTPATKVGEIAADQLTPEQAFDRHWALTVLDRAIERVRQDAKDSSALDQFELLRPYLTGEAFRPPYGDLAAELGMTEEAVRAALHRLRKRFGKMLRSVIAETLADPTHADDEIRYLLSVMV